MNIGINQIFQYSVYSLVVLRFYGPAHTYTLFFSGFFFHHIDRVSKYSHVLKNSMEVPFTDI